MDLFSSNFLEVHPPAGAANFDSLQVNSLTASMFLQVLSPVNQVPISSSQGKLVLSILAQLLYSHLLKASRLSG